MKERSPNEVEPVIDDLPIRWVSRARAVHDDSIITLLLSAKLTQKLGLEGRMVVVFKRNLSCADGMIILYCDDETYNIGRVIYDEFTNLFVIEKGDYEFTFLTDVVVIGVPFGYCDAERINDHPLRFRKI